MSLSAYVHQVAPSVQCPRCHLSSMRLLIRRDGTVSRKRAPAFYICSTPTCETVLEVGVGPVIRADEPLTFEDMMHSR